MFCGHCGQESPWPTRNVGADPDAGGVRERHDPTRLRRRAGVASQHGAPALPFAASPLGGQDWFHLADLIPPLQKALRAD
jgi:hypothetical protein